MTTFHPFPRLPAELRDHIWDLAVREDRPGAHYLILSNIEKDENKPDQSLEIAICEHSLAIPTRRNWTATSPVWNLGNPSTYMADSGMWTACHESRHAMERRFKAGYWKSERDKLRELKSLDSGYMPPPNSSATLSVRVASEQRYISIFPPLDLIVIQSSDPSTIYWDNLQLWNPLFSPFQGLRVNNLAFEVRPRDPVWSVYDLERIFSEQTVLSCVSSAATELIYTANIWFIDHRLRRVGNSPRQSNGHADQTQNFTAPEDARYEFYSNEHRYVEVREDDTEWTTVDTGPEYEHSFTIFHFVTYFYEALDEYYKYSDDRPVLPWSVPGLGVLAYEAI
ncbi:hypothetical protein TOPH_01931 [Tolypocladium ophioglossoides CBS 100239]|uniref:2EXR domain-containing protein n=1 Tax=Tolypocladium ophioglossoides (strain CBS 100239) TaxID=1163406 RepID=A0A0L0NHN4_TOLOC|nr:hypothetical protein TOPH_01931 [Tolypocladium ophioglossoides CBS 100239]